MAISLIVLMVVGTFFSSALTNTTLLLATLLHLRGLVRGDLSIPTLDTPLKLYILAFLTSTLFGFWPAYSFFYATELKRLLIPYLVTAPLAQSDRPAVHRFMILCAIVIGGTVTAAYAAYLRHFHSDMMPMAFSPTPTDMGILLVLSLGVLAGPLLYCSRMSLPWRATLAAVGALHIYGIMLCRNRSVLIGLAVALSFTLAAKVVYRGMRYAMSRFIILAVVMIVGVMTLPDGLLQRYFKGLDVQSESTQYRIRIYPLVAKMTWDWMPFGIGRRNFVLAHEYYKKPGGVIAPHAHSNILNISVELGILGLFSYLWIITSVIRRLLSSLRHPSRYNQAELGPIDEASIAAGLLQGFIAFHVAGFFIFNWGYSLPVSLMWVLVGLSFVDMSHQSPGQATETAEALII